jgi:pyrimidine deaminase RibD-like protein
MPIDTTAKCFSTADMNSNVTALMVYEAKNGGWVVKGKVTSGGGQHAEEVLAADLNGANQLNIAHGAVIYLEITKSPCYHHEDGKCCTDVLIGLKQSGRVSDIQVKYLGLYQCQSHKGAWKSVIGATAMEVEDISVDPWDPKTSVNAQQTVFMANYQKQYDKGKLGGGFWTDPNTRYGQTQKTPSKNFWSSPMEM